MFGKKNSPSTEFKSQKLKNQPNHYNLPRIFTRLLRQHLNYLRHTLKDLINVSADVLSRDNRNNSQVTSAHNCQLSAFSNLQQLFSRRLHFSRGKILEMRTHFFPLLSFFSWRYILKIKYIQDTLYVKFMYLYKVRLIFLLNNQLSKNIPIT